MRLYSVVKIFGLPSLLSHDLRNLQHLYGNTGRWRAYDSVQGRYSRELESMWSMVAECSAIRLCYRRLVMLTKVTDNKAMRGSDVNSVGN